MSSVPVFILVCLAPYSFYWSLQLRERSVISRNVTQLTSEISRVNKITLLLDTSAWVLRRCVSQTDKA